MRHVETGDALSSVEISSRRGDTTKTVLITLAVICGLMFLTCAGVGVAVYVWVQRNISNLVIEDPARIRTLTEEIVDITLPSELVPQKASSIFGVTFVSYGWCPTGTCPSTEDSALTLTSFGAGGPGSTPATESTTEVDTMANIEFNKFTKEEREFEIRGKKCKFVFVHGEPKSGSSDDEASEEEMKPEAKTETDPPATTGESKPGKKGTCTLLLNLNSDQYDEDKIVNMIKSIK
jgi:hypothetical protein